MSRAVDAVKAELRDLQKRIRQLQAEENRMERALALLTTTNPNVGAGTKRMAGQSRVIVRQGVTKPKKAQEAKSSAHTKPKPEHAPAWAVTSRGGHFQDQNGFGMYERAFLYKLATADRDHILTTEVPIPSSSMRAETVKKLNNAGLIQHVGTRQGPKGGHPSNMWALTTKGADVALRIRNEEGPPSAATRESALRARIQAMGSTTGNDAVANEIRLHVGEGVVA